MPQRIVFCFAIEKKVELLLRKPQSRKLKLRPSSSYLITTINQRLTLLYSMNPQLYSQGTGPGNTACVMANRVLTDKRLQFLPSDT